LGNILVKALTTFSSGVTLCSDTPAQAHHGLRDSIVRRWSVQQQAQRQRRRAENQKIGPQQQQKHRPPALIPVV
jgi:hypothetical protein